MPNNVIELVIRATDDASSHVKDIATQLGELTKTQDALRDVLGGIFAGFTVDKLVESITEAETATNELNRQFANFGANVGVTKDDMLDFASQTSKATTLTNESLKAAQANLLNYTSITGESFKEARDIVVDLAAKMGGDAAQAATLLGRALENPVSGIRLLAQVGVTLTQSQRQTIESLTQTGDKATAVAFIMDQLRLRTHGAADELANTLGGALTQLKNSFAQGFTGEGSGVDDLVGSLHDLNAVISDPEFQNSLHNLVAGTVDVSIYAAQAAKDFADFATSIGEGLAHATGLADTVEGQMQDKIAALKQLAADADNNGGDSSGIIKQIDALQKRLDALKKEGEFKLDPEFGTTDGDWDSIYDKIDGLKDHLAGIADSFKNVKTQATALVDELEKPIVAGAGADSEGNFLVQNSDGSFATANQKNLGGRTPVSRTAPDSSVYDNPFIPTALVQQYLKDTESDIDKAEDELNQHIRERAALVKANAISPFDAFVANNADQKAFDAQLDKALADVQVTAKKMEVPLDDIQKEGLAVAQGLTNAFESFFESGIFTGRNFANTMIKFFEQILAKAASIDLVNALGLNKLFNSASDSGASGQLGGLFSAFGSIFSSGVSSKSLSNEEATSSTGLSDEGIIATLAKAAGFFSGGGQTDDSPHWVGESGPELEVPGTGGSSHIYNQRELASMGGGGNLTVHNGDISVSIVAADAQDTKAELYKYIAYQQAQNNAALLKTLQRNGYTVKR